MNDNRIVLIHKAPRFFLAVRKFNQFTGRSVGHIGMVGTPSVHKWIAYSNTGCGRYLIFETATLREAYDWLVDETASRDEAWRDMAQSFVKQGIEEPKHINPWQSFMKKVREKVSR